MESPRLSPCCRIWTRGDTLCISTVVIGEVYAGLEPRDRPQAQAWLPTLEYLDTTAAMAQQAGEWKYAYARRGTTLALTDCLIAATAHGHGALLVTGNARDFPQSEVQKLPLPRPGRAGGQR